MTWQMRAVVTQHLGAMGAPWLADALGLDALGRRLETLDWSTPCVRWTDMYLPSSRNGSRTRIAHIELWPGSSPRLRSVATQEALVRSLSRSSGAYGLVAVSSASDATRCAAAYWQGHCLERWDARGVTTATERRIAPNAERAMLDAWLLWIAGAEIFDLDTARVEGVTRTRVYALPESPAQYKGASVEKRVRSMAVLFIGLDKWENRGVAPPAGFSMRWDETEGRGADYRECYVVLQGDVPLEGKVWDALCQSLGCDGAAAQVGHGEDVLWWDWSLGFPGHCGTLRGVAEFVQVWAGLCQRMRVPPASFVGIGLGSSDE